MMHDYSEGFINIRKLLDKAEGECRKNKLSDARQTIEELRAEADRLFIWLWKNEDA